MHTFITIIRRRLNTGIALNAILRSLTIAAIITCILGLTYIFRGHAVAPLIVYPIGLIIALLVSLTLWFTQRKNKTQSAIFADQHFHLKDSLTSALEFEHDQKEGSAYQLQKQQTLTSIENLSPDSIPLPFSKKLYYYTALSLIAATSLAFIPPSEAVLKEREEKQHTQQRTSEIKKSIDKEIEELISSLSEEEKQAVDPNAIRQWVKELKATDDKREALRNIARIEQKIQKKIDSLLNRKNEELLKAAGIKMLKAQHADSKELGKHLKNKHFKKAAQKLEKFKLSKKQTDPKIDKNKLKKLTEKQKQLAKLREITKHLSQSKSQANPNGAQGKSLSLEQFAEALQDAGIQLDLENLKLQDLKNLPPELLKKLPPELLKKLENGQLRQLPPELLEKLLELMQQDADDLQEMMEEMELEQMQGEELTDEEWEELLEQLKNMDENLESLQRMLERLEAMKGMRKKLNSLKQSLGQAQGFANGNKSLSQFLMRAKGGKLPGLGTDNTRRKQKDKLLNNKQYSKLKGQKGKGPVKSTIEEADSGTGTSNRRGKAKQRTFEHQMSSFIERDDVPEEMKQGVKQYFEDIHKTSK